MRADILALLLIGVILVAPVAAVENSGIIYLDCSSLDGWTEVHPKFKTSGDYFYRLSAHDENGTYHNEWRNANARYELPAGCLEGDFSLSAKVLLSAASPTSADNRVTVALKNRDDLIYSAWWYIGSPGVSRGVGYGSKWAYSYSTDPNSHFVSETMCIERSGDTVTITVGDYRVSVPASNIEHSQLLIEFEDEWSVPLGDTDLRVSDIVIAYGVEPCQLRVYDAKTYLPISGPWSYRLTMYGQDPISGTGDGGSKSLSLPKTSEYKPHLIEVTKEGYSQINCPLAFAVPDGGADVIVYLAPNTTSPIADFSATPTTGLAPLTIQFTDTSGGSPTSWAWEFGDGWGSGAQNPTHTYVAPGTYTVTLTAYNSVGSDVKTRSSYITVGNTPQPSDAVLNGYAYDNTNNVLLDGVTITIENETYSTTNTTYGGGFYQFTGLSPGTYTVKGEKAGYLASPGYAVQLYSGAVVQRDISLGVSGVAIVGTVYDAVTGEKLNGANVTATQGSASYSSTGAGQYTLNGLSKGVETTITATLAGYTHTPVTLTPTSSTPYTVDLYLIPDSIAHNGTALAGLVTDAATHNAIANAQVSFPGHPNATTSPTGFYLIDDLAAGSYYVSASATGYNPSQDYAVTLTEGNLTWQDITLDPATETATHMDYPPHLVRFLCIDEYNRPLQNVTIQAVYQESSSPIDWLAEWLGIAPDVQVTTETLEGRTGLDGSVVFLMVQSVQYRVTVAAPDLNMTKTFDLYPKEDQITIRFVTSPGPDLSTMPAYDLTATETDPSSVRLALTYNDTTNATTHLSFQVYDHATGELIHSQNFAASSFPGTVSPTYDVSNTNGAMYRFGFTAQNSAHGEISQYKGITLKGDNLLVNLGFEDRTLYQWLAVLLLFLFAGAFSGTNVKQGAILVPLFGGGLFWYIGWLPITLGAAISAIGFLGVLLYMRKSEWKVRA